MKAVMALVIALVPILGGAQQLNVKLGAWEMTHKSAMFPRPMVERECVTKADLAQLAGGADKDDDGDCKYVKQPTVTGNKWLGDKVCSDGRKAHAEFVAETPERVKGTIISTAPKGAQQIKLEIDGRWLGVSCAGIN